MPLRDKQTAKRTEGVLQAMNELTGWDSRTEKPSSVKESKRDKK